MVLNLTLLLVQFLELKYPMFKVIDILVISKRLSHLGSSSKAFTIQNVNSSDEKVDDSNIIHDYKSQLNYPLTISLDESDQSESNSADLKYEAKIAYAKEAIVHVDGKNVMSTSTSQNGKSTYVLSHEGNHWFGDLKLNIS